MNNLACIGLAIALAAACTTPARRAASAPTDNVVASAASGSATATVAPPATTIIAPGQALQAGQVTFTGMVVPTKGGYRIGDAIVEGSVLTTAVPPPAPGAVIDAEWFVGARLQVTGVVEQMDETATTTADGLQQQTRAGSWLALRRIDAVTVTSPAVMIEGTLTTSKGFFAIDQYLINRPDLGWALAPNGGKPGEKLRLWGQPHVVTCAPEAQCLISGQLPIFEVARAQRLTN